MNQSRQSFFESAEIRESQSSRSDEIDLIAIGLTLWRGRRWIAAAFVLGLSLAWYQANIRAIPMFQSTASLALEAEQGQVISLESVVQNFSGDDASLATEVEVLQSRGLITKLVDALNLTEDPEFNTYLLPPPSFNLRGTIQTYLIQIGIFEEPEAATRPPTEQEMLDRTVNRVQGSVDVVNQEWSYVLSITARSQDPTKAALLANTLANLYIEDRLEVKFEKTRQATAWLSDRVIELEQDVEASASELKAYLADADVVNEETLAAMNLRLKDQRDRLNEAILDRDTATIRLDALATAQSSGQPAEMAASAEDAVLQRLLPQAEAGDANSTRLFERRFDEITDRTRDEQARLDNQVTVLERSVTRQQSEISQQSDELVTAQQLEREAEADRLIYEYFLTRLKETSVQEGIQQADARVISAAVEPTWHYAPRERRLLALGALMGLVIGSGLILLRERFVTEIRTPEELEEISGLPVIGQIPRIPGRTRAKVIKYIVNKPASAAVEAIRNLRASLLLSNVSAPPQVIMVASALPGDGKTVTTLALASNYAGLGKKVLIVEGDIRRRVMGQFLKADKNGHGLIDVLENNVSIEDAVCHPKNLRLDVLFGSETDANPADIFSSDGYSAFIKNAREAYDVILIDTPPLLVVSDARIIGQSADATIFTVLWNRTKKAQVTDALRLLSSVGLRVTGTVLQNVDPVGMRRLGQGERLAAYSARYGRTYYRN